MDERLLVKGQSAGIPQRLPNCMGQFIRGCISCAIYAWKYTGCGGCGQCRCDGSI